ncbi:MAG: AraC family transcriptional regulator [Planctomycetota bacterium]
MPRRADELLPESIKVSRSWDHITLMQRNISKEGYVDVPEGGVEHLLVLNTKPNPYSIQNRDSRRYESEYPAHAINLVPAYEAYTWEWADSKNAYLSTHTCLDPALVRRVAEEVLGMNPDVVQLRHLFNVHDQQMHRLISLLHQELTGGDVGSALYVDSLSQALALHLLRNYAVDAPPAPQGPPRIGHRDLDQVRQYIEAHLGDDITLDQLAGVTELSKHHFARLFKQSMGQTPHRYLMERRVERAKQLLRSPAEDFRTIASIALACGFTDQSHLGRHFKRIVGVTPAEFRLG